MLTENGTRSWGWVAVVVVGLLSFACGASFSTAPPTTGQFRHEDERD
jgi:hypothetical protein